VVTGGGTAARVVTTGGEVVETGAGEGITGWVHPENAIKQRRIAIPITNRSRPGEMEGCRDIYGDWLTGF
jgi:hypothetical protein